MLWSGPRRKRPNRLPERSARLIHSIAERDCLEIPDRYYSGVPRVVEMKPESLFCRLECHQTRTLKGPLAIIQTVSSGISCMMPRSATYRSTPTYGVSENE